jgi:hypothetical protein
MSLQDMDDLEAVVGEVARVLHVGGHFCFAILHPFRSAGRWANEGSFVVTDSYFERHGYVVSDELDDVRVEMWSEHRPLEAYMKALETNGFVVEALREPQPSEEVVRSDGLGTSDKWRRVPFSLHVRARKVAPGALSTT